MGSMDDARTAAAVLRQQITDEIGQLQGIGQSVGSAQQELRGRLGRTSHPKVLETEGRCREAQQKIAEAIQALNAASEAAARFSTGLH